MEKTNCKTHYFYKTSYPRTIEIRSVPFSSGILVGQNFLFDSSQGVIEMRSAQKPELPSKFAVDFVLDGLIGSKRNKIGQGHAMS